MWPAPLILMGPLLQAKKFHAGARLPDHASSNVSGEAVRTLTDARSNPPSEDTILSASETSSRCYFRKCEFEFTIKPRADLTFGGGLELHLGFGWDFWVCNTYLQCTALERGKTSADIRPIYKHHFRTLFQFHSRSVYHTGLQNPN